MEGLRGPPGGRASVRREGFLFSAGAHGTSKCANAFPGKRCLIGKEEARDTVSFVFMVVGVCWGSPF